MTKFFISFIALFIMPFATVVAQKNQTKNKSISTNIQPAKSTEKGALFFEQTEINIGTISDEIVSKKVSFKFKNIGKGKVKIISATSDCNCTKPQFNANPIEYSKEGSIDVDFFTKNLSGREVKTITVYTDGEPSVYYLTIIAQVNNELTRAKDQYPSAQGNFRFDSYEVKFPNIYTDGIDSTFRFIYNSSSKKINISKIITPNHISVVINQNSIMPGYSTRVKFVYNAAIAMDYGSKLDEIVLVTDDSIVPEKKFLIRSSIIENFDLRTEKEKKYPPVFVSLNPEINLGNVNFRDSVVGQFTISNSGKSPLYIRKVYSTCGCTNIKFDPSKPIKKGKKAIITFTYKSNYDYGNISQPIYVITNTPDSPEHKLTFKVRVDHFPKK